MSQIVTAQMPTYATPTLRKINTDPDFSPSMDQWNDLLYRLGVEYRSEHHQRTLLGSEVFNINTATVIGDIDIYLQLPHRLRLIRKKASYGEIARAQPPLGGACSFISLTALPLHYFVGRQLLIDLGDISAANDKDDNLEVLRFWRESTIAMRKDGVLLNIDANPTNSVTILDDAVVNQISADLAANPADRVAVRRFAATAMAYAFLENCDSRVGVSDSGPYLRPDGSYLALRHIVTSDNPRYRPWAADLIDRVDRHHFVIAYELPATVRMTVNVWGSAWFQPADYISQVRATGVYTTDEGSLQQLTDNEIVHLTDQLRDAHARLYRRFAEMSRRERTITAAQVYAWMIDPWAQSAGVVDDIDWALCPRVTSMYSNFTDPEVTARALRNVVLVPHRESCYEPID